MFMRPILILLCTFLWIQGRAQNETKQSIEIKVVSDQQQALSGAMVELFRSTDSSLVKVQMTDSAGLVRFPDIAPGDHWLRISKPGYTTQSAPATSLHTFILAIKNHVMEGVTVAAKKPFIELRHDKTVVNLDASVTQTGTTALEALEKLPGVSLDREGNINLKGKSNVLVLIDGKPTYLGNSELVNLLSGMSASQISQVELIDQPSARYDASGNAGIINIKTKKNRQRGFNGAVTVAAGQGRYPKNNNSLQLNYHTGRINYFLNYSLNANRNFTRLYALRTYFENDGHTPAALLEQPSYIRTRGTTHNLRTGIDYFPSAKTTIGLALSGLRLTRGSLGNNTAAWMDAQRNIDSVITTENNNNGNWKNGGMNINFRQVISESKELTADADMIDYRIQSGQYFENRLEAPGGYTEANRGNIPSRIKIYSLKTDYAMDLIKNTKGEAGWKIAHITTNNLAAYQFLEGSQWKEDLSRSNHFLYRETIHALYGNAQTKQGRWTAQGGLRYEYTSYDATQLGNAVQKDSSFSRSYNSFFPSASLSWVADSANSFSLRAGRRIDRPAFQKLNPFLFIINKYTYQQGNPYYRPQYTWNVEASHMYREILMTTLSYSLTNDHFSQYFLADTSGTIIYTEGNLGRLQQIGLSFSLQLSPAPWWNLSAQATGNYKIIEGVVWKVYHETITQMTASMNNQFRFKKGWSGELSGTYTTKSQQDVQEIVDPSGQLSVGLAKSVFKNKGTVRLALRDIFYTQAMKGNTYFRYAHEYFSLTRDSRVATISFSYRFGKAVKQAKRSGGASGDEVQRVGNGN
jgi:iron complex outermembrane receptor protein